MLLEKLQSIYTSIPQKRWVGRIGIDKKAYWQVCVVRKQAAAAWLGPVRATSCFFQVARTHMSVATCRAGTLSGHWSWGQLWCYTGNDASCLRRHDGDGELIMDMRHRPVRCERAVMWVTGGLKTAEPPFPDKVACSGLNPRPKKRLITRSSCGRGGWSNQGPRGVVQWRSKLNKYA